jgi:ankyrin repeat protein
LHKKEANINATDCLGNNALHLAVQKSNNIEIIKYLVEQVKLNVNLKNVENQTALHLATYYGNKDVVEFLIASGAQVDVRDKNNALPLHIAAAYGHTSFLELFLSKGNTIIMYQFTPFSKQRF